LGGGCEGVEAASEAATDHAPCWLTLLSAATLLPPTHPPNHPPNQPRPCCHKHCARVVAAPLSHLHDDLLDGLVVVLGVDAVSGPPLARSIKLGWVDVYRKYARSTCALGRLNDGQTHRT